MPLYGLGWVAYLQGDYAHARLRIEESLAMLRDVGNTRSVAVWLNVLADVVRHQGDIQRATALYSESLVLYRELGSSHGIAGTLHNLGSVAQIQGDMQRATALYSESMVLYQGLENKIGVVRCLVGLAGIAGGQGTLALAARLLGAAATLSAGSSLPVSARADYDRHLAGLRARLDERTFAAAWEEGRAMTLEQAVVQAQQAMLPEQTVESSPPKAAPPTPAYPAGLTTREVEVLRLVAQGLTNAQVAAKLVIAPRTVNVHLTSIYSKLQVTSRTAAARYAVEHNLI
jgi:DNA-binding NarL/FixJ family response regulator